MEHFAWTQERGRRKVLVAEEDARLRRIVRLNLECEGFETSEASSLDECENRLREESIGLVVVSSQLPGFDSHHFSLWLRSEFPRQAVPVVILSFDPEDRLLTQPLRVAAFRRKPFDPGELVIQVSKLMHTA